LLEHYATNKFRKAISCICTGLIVIVVNNIKRGPDAAHPVPLSVSRGYTPLLSFYVITVIIIRKILNKFFYS